MNKSTTIERQRTATSISPANWLRSKFARWAMLDTVVVSVIALFGLLIVFAVLLAPRFLIPAEDAVILFQYSRNLATTGAITYIAHGPRAEGATDFLWMILIAVGIKLGAKPMWVVALFNLASLATIVWVVFRIAKARIRPLAALFIVGAFGLFPQIFAAVLGFSVLPFAALLLLLSYAFLQQSSIAMPIIALLLCLFRPDGVVFAIPLLMAALLSGNDRSRRLAFDLALFVIPGLLYFLWRWHYFQELLPLPFLVKSDAQRKAHFLVLSSLQSAKALLLFTFIVAFAAIRRRWADQRNRVVLLCVLVLPNLFYLAMRLDQNIGGRFFIYLPVGLAILIAINWQHLRPYAHSILRIGVLAWVVILCASWLRECSFLLSGQCDNRKAIAQDLAALPHGRLLTTEAGIAAYYSGWNTYDAWGLNTATFARRLFEPSDVSALNPDLILVYTSTSPEDCVRQADWQIPYKQRKWSNLTRNIVSGADPTHYALHIVPADGTMYRSHEHMSPWQGNQECWYVRKDSPLRADISAILARHGAMTLSQYESHQLPISAFHSRQQPTAQKHTLSSILLLPLRAAVHLWRYVVYE